MVLCSLLRNYEQHQSIVDQSTVDQISTLIRKVINTEEFIKNKDISYEAENQRKFTSVLSESLF